MAERFIVTNTIKRGVSLYSFQNETFQGKMDLEDCIRTCAQLGARGIEIIGEQTFWGWPEVGVADADIDNWHRLIAKYDCVPVSHDYMLDYKRYKDRPMPFEEQVASVRNDIDLGARLGMPFIRSLVSIAPEVLVAAAPYAEGYTFTSALPTQALKTIMPALQPLLQKGLCQAPARPEPAAAVAGQ